MKILSYTLFVVFIFGYYDPCLASTESIFPVVSLQQAPASLENQIQNLEIKVNLLEQINGKILNTIYWALSGLVTVFLTIIGLNFFQSFNLNKRKIDDIREENNSELKKNISNFQEQSKKNFESISSKIEPKIKSEVQSALSQLKGKMDEIKDDYDDVKRDNYIRSAFEHKAKDQMGYILNMIYALEIDIKKNWDWRIHQSLDYISACLDEGFKNSDILTQLQIALDKLPSEYSAAKKKIESKMIS
jgi:hypothetical protein